MSRPRKSRLPKPLPEGFTLADSEKKRWRLGRLIGQGGFGLIYLASQDVDSAVAENTGFVIKVEYHENGPLFSELKFYQRAAKAELIECWKKSRRLSFLGIPTYWGSGLAEYNGLRYRFMAMERLGRDLQKVSEGNGGQMKRATVLQIGQRLLDALEYIHDHEYVHADIKAANLMLGYTDPEKVYLADYGLAYRYRPEGVHKEYSENPKKGHNGTMEYTSLDAHRGVAPSRRGDIQVLGFCLLHWLCGALPWDGMLTNPAQVQEAKAKLMDNLPHSVQQLSASGSSTEVARLLLHVKSLDYQQQPDYQMLRDLLGGGVQGRLDFSGPHGCPAAGALEDPLPRGKVGTSKRPPKSTTGAAVLVTKTKPSGVRQGTGAYSPRTGQRGGASRGTSKPEAMELKEGELARETKPIPSQYLRGPPANRPELQASGTAVARRSPRARAVPTGVYKDYSESEDDEEDGEDWEDWEEETIPIAACHLRGPPISPRPEQTSARTLHNRRREDVRYVCTKSKTGSTAPRHVRFLDPPRGWGRGRGLLEREEPSPGAPREVPAISLIAGPVWWNMFVCGTVFATLFFVVVCVEALR